MMQEIIQFVLQWNLIVSGYGVTFNHEPENV